VQERFEDTHVSTIFDKNKTQHARTCSSIPASTSDTETGKLSHKLVTEKLVLSVKKETVILPLLHVLPKLFGKRSRHRRFLDVFDGLKLLC
jgi:hypothetical protein